MRRPKNPNRRADEEFDPSWPDGSLPYNRAGKGTLNDITLRNQLIWYAFPVPLHIQPAYHGNDIWMEGHKIQLTIHPFPGSCISLSPSQ